MKYGVDPPEAALMTLGPMGSPLTQDAFLSPLKYK